MSLYLQEPLCAARVFVDGKDLGGSGSVGGADVIGGTGSTDMAHGAAGGYRPLFGTRFIPSLWTARRS